MRANATVNQTSATAPPKQIYTLWMQGRGSEPDDKDAERMQNFKDVPDQLVRAIRAPTLIILGDQDIVKPEHAVELTRLISGARVLILPSGHGDYLGEAVTTQKDTHYPELTARLIEEFLDSQ